MKTLKYLLLLSLLIFGATPSHAIHATITRETVEQPQFETLRPSIKIELGGTTGRKVKVRVYRLNPRGVGHTVVKQKTVTLRGPWGTRNNVLIVRNLEAGTGIRYAVTFEPVGNLRTQLTTHTSFLTADGGLHFYPWPGDALHHPYPLPQAYRAPQNAGRVEIEGE